MTLDYLHIPIGLLKLDLSRLGLCVLQLIATFESNGLRLSNAKIAGLVGTDRRCIVRVLRQLKTEGYITRTAPDNFHRRLFLSKKLSASIGTTETLPAKTGRDRTDAKIGTARTLKIGTARSPRIKVNQKTKSFSRNSDEFRLAKLLLDEILKRKPDFKKPDLQKWSIQVSWMLRLDGRKPEKIAAVIRWVQMDEFWQKNILSTAKLRKQFDRLEMVAENGKVNNYGKTTAKRIRFDELQSEYGETIVV